MIQDLRTEIEGLVEFPPMPEMAREIMALGPEPSAQELARVVDKDPAMAGQIMRYALSPFFGYRGKIHSVQAAVSRVLGVERAIELVFGLAAGKTFLGPNDGPVGRLAVWTHGLATATLAHALAAEVPQALRPAPGMCYLAGLFQDIGLLLLGHLYPAHIRSLNRALEDDPDASLADVEQRMFGIDHTESGTFLLRKWNMPADLITAVRQHHNPDYHGDHLAHLAVLMFADHYARCYEQQCDVDLELCRRLAGRLDLDVAAALATSERIAAGFAHVQDLARDLIAA